MIKDDKNLNLIKDANNETTCNLEDNSSHNLSVTLTYPKTNKLITALYMVTDTIHINEPVRLKLRTLGAEIISDINHINSFKKEIFIEKINEIMSFLDIACTVGMISTVNSNILGREFTELKKSAENYKAKNYSWLEHFMLDSSATSSEKEDKDSYLKRDVSGAYLKSNKSGKFSANASSVSSFMNTGKINQFDKGQSTRIGVQSGGTLLKALNKIEMSDNNFSNVKNKRRELVINIIKNKPNGISIKDIMTAVRNLNEDLGEKTIQRELVSMMSDNILYRTGSKRWSQYFLKH